MSNELIKAGASAVAGAVLAWTAHSFTIDGQLKAFEAALLRIEHRLDQLAARTPMQPPQGAAR